MRSPGVIKGQNSENRGFFRENQSLSSETMIARKKQRKTFDSSGRAPVTFFVRSELILMGKARRGHQSQKFVFLGKCFS